MTTRRHPLRKMSRKRAEEWKVYRRLKRQFLKERPLCERCLWLVHHGEKKQTAKATCVHHWAGRRSNFLSMVTWRASCDECNLWAKNNPKEAREEGWIAPEGMYKV